VSGTSSVRRGAALLLALAASCAAAARPAPSTPPASSIASEVPRPGAVAALDASLQPLRARFDAGAGRPRLLVLASPT